MKKILYILTLLLTFSTCFSQLEYHNWLFGSHGYYHQSNYLNGITFMTETGSPEFYNVEMPYDIKYTPPDIDLKDFYGNISISGADGNLRYYAGRNTLVSFNPDSIIAEKSLFPRRMITPQGNSIVSVNNKTIVIRTMSIIVEGDASIINELKELSYFVIS